MGDAAWTLVTVIALIVACGCVNQAANQSQVRLANTLDTNFGGEVKSYNLRETYLRLGDSVFHNSGVHAGIINIDLKNNAILWEGGGSKRAIPLKLVRLEADNAVFLYGVFLLCIEKHPGEGDTVTLFLNGLALHGTTPYSQTCQTPKGSFREFYSAFNQLKFPDNFHGLVASTKYIDGTPVQISPALATSIQLVGKACSLNEKPAHLYRSTLANGSGVIVIDNGDDNLVLWPDGNWLLSSSNNAGTQFAGLDDSLKETYITLRQRTEELSQPGQQSGTGFFITDDGYLITNNHVVKGAAQVRVVTSAGIISTKVVRVDLASDLAVLKAEGRFAPLPIVASRGVKLGSTVATVGFPNIGLQGFAPKLAKGEIASLSGAGDDARYFQISVPVQPGNSGGALVDERGKGGRRKC